MPNYQSIIPIVEKILEEYNLCNNCLGRLFAKQLNLSSHNLLGKKLQKNPKSNQKCFICKNLFDHIDSFLNLMFDSSKDYYFSTFSVGTIIKPSLVDRDDFIRSKYQLKGIDSVKTGITKELNKLFSRKTKKIIDLLDPDATFTINLKDQSCQLRTKSITLFGRYVKNSRNLIQKQKSCTNCNGKGCRICDFHGISEFNSVEGLISKFLFEQYGGTTAKFTWIGGEDKSSLVLGTGRPFFVKIQNPVKRKLLQTSIIYDSLKIHHLKTVMKSPIQPIQFISSIKIKISTSSEINSNNLKILKNLILSPIVIYEKSGKRIEKNILSIKYKRISDIEFHLFIVVEGGFPVKRFVSGDDVVPSVSTLLDVSCICKEFDFSDIEIK